MLVSAWNVAQLDQMAMQPCIYNFQFGYSKEKGTLDLLVNHRAGDMLLGVPHDITSCALLVHMMAHVISNKKGTEVKPGRLIMQLANPRLYENQYEEAKTLLSRANELRDIPQLEILNRREEIGDFQYDDFKLINYNPHNALSPEVASYSKKNNKPLFPQTAPVLFDRDLYTQPTYPPSPHNGKFKSPIFYPYFNGHADHGTGRNGNHHVSHSNGHATKGAIIILGPSLSGKGTLADSLGDFLDIPARLRISGGQILRDISKDIDTLEDRAEVYTKYGISHEISVLESSTVTEPEKQYIRSTWAAVSKDFPNKQLEEISEVEWFQHGLTHGSLLPSNWSENMLEYYFTDHQEELRNSTFILDGHPRTKHQAEHLIRLFKQMDIPVSNVLNIDLSREQAIKRGLSRNRTDDTYEAIGRRYDFYVHNAHSAVDFLKEELGAQAVSVIDGYQPVFNAEGDLDVAASKKLVFQEACTKLGIPAEIPIAHLSFPHDNGHTSILRITRTLN